MRQSNLDFHIISRALSYSIEALRNDEQLDDTAIEKLTVAQEELQRALSFSLSATSKYI